MKRRCIIIAAMLLLISNACVKRGINIKLSERSVTRVINQMTAVMVHDVTNPPLAARFYAYACLAGYEVVVQKKGLASMKGVLNEFPVIAKPGGIQTYDVYLSATLAIYRTAEALQPSGYILKKDEDRFVDSCRSVGFSDAVISGSMAYANLVSKAVLNYAKHDGYVKISNYQRYTPGLKPGMWNPTPPSYMAPVEPYFYTVRPFTLDSASQFFTGNPVPFSLNKTSSFYKQMLESQKKGADDLSREEIDAANFWDCNPFAVKAAGHMLVGLKKISPGAHWMGICSIACLQQKTGFVKALQIHTILSVALTDGFISCWDSKYKTNRIRPETAIRDYLDRSWKPFLQTPPFPEYVSGHSVISAVSANILSRFFGDHYGFTDSVESSYGIPPRRFNSFDQAAREAALSRFYGGIHFMDAIEEGLIQGKKVGDRVADKFRLGRKL
ncbi:vanadium-dependent haloperoxidase [Mucilaginibacter litoreus]|uniref:Vanadium-dependent haloperoxidase n=1 Tax=Mucilaginibacter litoreus TaxID=1048221 RepID=A0ABW3APW9_9SPHI